MRVLVLQDSTGWVCGVFYGMKEVGAYLRALYGVHRPIELSPDQDRTRFLYGMRLFYLSVHPLETP